MYKFRLICLIILQASYSWALESYNNKEISEAKAAQCLPKNENVQDYLTKKYKRTYEPLKWKGIDIPAPRTGLVKLLNALFYSDIGNQSHYMKFDVIKNYPGIEKCSYEICIADKIFGEGNGAYYLYFLDKFNFNLSPYATKIHGNSDLYKDRNFFDHSELEVIRSALHMLPKSVFKHYKFGTHFKKIAHYDENTIADSALRFYQLFSDIPKNEQISAILHEVAHNISDITALEELDYGNEWIQLSTWTSYGDSLDPRDLKIYNDSKNFVSNYALSSPAEDFAESFTAYIVNPFFLQKKAPAKYKFLKDRVFKSIEYKTKNCMTRKSVTLSNILKGTDITRIAKSCLESFVESIPTSDKTLVNKCIILNSGPEGNIPLDFDIVADMSSAKEVQEYREILREIIDLFNQRIFKTPSYCQEHPALAFQYDDSELFADGSNYTLHSQSKNICRWTMTANKIKKSEKTDENLRKELGRILEQRIFN